MDKKAAIKLFEAQKIRMVWDEQQEKWFFSIVDVCGVLSKSENPRKYWSVLKTRLLAEGSELTTNCSQLKMKASDGKMRMTDVADTEQLLRLVQSIPSPKAEPFKLWLAQVGSERLDEMADPELTDTITETWSGHTTRSYKNLKDLKKENLRDNMTNIELVLNMLAEASTTEISKLKKPENSEQNVIVAKQGGSGAKAARDQLEETTGESVIISKNASDIRRLAESARADEE